LLFGSEGCGLISLLLLLSELQLVICITLFFGGLSENTLFFELALAVLNGLLALGLGNFTVNLLLGNHSITVGLSLSDLGITISILLLLGIKGGLTLYLNHRLDLGTLLVSGLLFAFALLDLLG